MRSFSLRQPWGLALQNLLQDTLRLALSVVGIALALMLILFLLGLRAGIFLINGVGLVEKPSILELRASLALVRRPSQPLLWLSSL